jgi:hypothetical protein
MSKVRPWNLGEMAKALRLSKEGVPVHGIAAIMRRSVTSVEQHVFFAKVVENPEKYHDVVRGHESFVLEHWSDFRPYEIGKMLNTRTAYVDWIAKRLNLTEVVRPVKFKVPHHSRRKQPYSAVQIQWALDNFVKSKEARTIAMFVEESEKAEGLNDIAKSEPLTRQLRKLWRLYLKVTSRETISEPAKEGELCQP